MNVGMNMSVAVSDLSENTWRSKCGTPLPPSSILSFNACCFHHELSHERPAPG